MASKNKTQETAASVADFLAEVADPARRRDCEQLVTWMEAATGRPARMWGTSIVGFGRYHYRYESGREGDFMRAGFSPRKKDLSLYLMAHTERHSELLSRLGKHRMGKSCLYIKRLDQVDTAVLQELIEESVKEMARRYPDDG